MANMDDFLDEVFDSSDAFGDIDECVYVAPDQNGHVPWGSCRAYYLYYPSQAGNGVFAVLFALATLVLFQQMCHYRKFYSIVAVTAGVMEFIAFVVRAVGARMQQKGDLIAGSNFMMLLAPLVVNAFLYMTYSRVVRCMIPKEDAWRARHRWIAHCYFWLLLAAAVAETAALGIMFSRHDRTFAAAQKVYVGGLALQAIFNVELAFVVCRAARRLEDLDSLGRPTRHARLLLWAVFTALGLLLLRIVYRIVDFSIGLKPSNPLARSEVPAFVLDALPMFLILLLFILCPPGRVLFTADKKRHTQPGVGAAPAHAHFVNQAPPRYQPREEQPSSLPVAVLADEPRRPDDDEDMFKGEPVALGVRHHDMEPVSPVEEDTARSDKKAWAKT